MKIMKKRLSRKHWAIIATSSLGLMLYFGIYLHFRIRHTFIHRAGNYDADISRGRPRFHTNHFIEPGRGAAGPQILAKVLISSVTNSGTNDLDEAEFEHMIAGAAQQAQDMEKRRDQLFLIFEPAAFLEILVWKAIDPHPLTSR